MSQWEYIALFSAIILAILRFLLTYFTTSGKPPSERFPPDRAIETIMISCIFYAVVSLSSTTIPRIAQNFNSLRSLTYDDPLYKTFERIVSVHHHITEIKDTTIHSIFNSRFEWATDNYYRDLKTLQQDAAVIPRDQAIQFAKSLLGVATHTIKATSYVNPSDWWQTPEGRLYIEDNTNAIKRGVS